jgi:nitrate ABC transporter ATP-binding subunit
MTSEAAPSRAPTPHQPGSAFLALEGVSKTFAAGKGQQKVIDRLSLGVQEGEFVTFIGPSGCGKSTLLNLIAGLQTPSEGSIRLAGRPVTKPGSDRGVVFQQHLLLPWMTAYENVRFALDCTMPRSPAVERDRLARHYLAMVQLSDAAAKKPGQLSGGMQQRVGIARAFAIRPRVLLLDEPFGALDAVTRAALQDQLLCVWEVERRTVVMVTHDVDEALLLSDRVLVMSGAPRAVVRRDITVPFPRPRDRSTLLQQTAYHRLRADLIMLLTHDLAG